MLPFTLLVEAVICLETPKLRSIRMQQIEEAAYLSVMRACSYATLAAFTIAMGFAGQPSLALKAVGIVALLTAVVLLIKAERADRMPYRQTEAWMMAGDGAKLDPKQCQKIVTEARRKAFQHFGLSAGRIAVAFLAMSLIANIAVQSFARST
jgi:hypothetical protein